ncbi:MAG: enoyl-CoA hydratase-related protein [Burkholderiaceae bacterium]|nr:enoyl-CoA hydratase-related protein [Burkholderiaceae bacterium]
MEPSILLNKRSDGVAVLTLNRPGRLNAFNREMIDSWRAAVEDAFADTAVRVLVVTGAGRAFCAGGDADEMNTLPDMDSMDKKNNLWEHIHRIAMAMDRSDKPVIAAVNGTARGAGCDMALMCDLRIAAQSATFAESYIDFGLIAGDAGAYFLPRIVGVARALELFWTGRVVDSAEAERIGLVNRVVPDAQLLDTALELAALIASQPEKAVQMYKRTVYQSQAMALTTHLDMVSSHMAVLQSSKDFRDRVATFLQRKLKNLRKDKPA